MAYISVPEGVPGIRSLATFRHDTSRLLYELAQALLRGESPLSPAERELIAAFVSMWNGCIFCMNAHGGIAQHYLQCDLDFIDNVKKDYLSSPLPEKLKALLSFAASVQAGGKHVSEDQISKAYDLGATEREIHDTVLIAAAFCMYNRYVDGLGTWAPQDREIYVKRGKQGAEEEYLDFNPYGK